MHDFYITDILTMIKENTIGFPYAPLYEKHMKAFYDSLNEKDKRHYVALEAEKLHHGGITYLAKLFNCSRTTIYEGLEEIKKK